MSKFFKYKSGDPWCNCDICGFTYRNSQLKENHNGYHVCSECYESRHPQEYLRTEPDNIMPGCGEDTDEFLDEPFDTSYRTQIPGGTFTTGFLLLQTSTVNSPDYLLQEDGVSKLFL